MKHKIILGSIISIGIIILIVFARISVTSPLPSMPVIIVPSVQPETTEVVKKKETPPIQLETVFDDKNAADNTAADTLILLRATGDVMPARSVNTQTTKRGDYTWAFQATSEYLKRADITLVNLETPLVDPCPLTDEGMVFCGATQHAGGLRFAGVDVVNVANNHTENFGIAGVEQTLTALRTNGFGVSGMGMPYVTTVKGIRFGFLGYNDIVTGQNVISVYDEHTVREDIQSLRANADVIIVSYHWGVEYTSKPSTRQITIARQTIDDGADLIIGNHPHWIQPMEIYKNRVIMYSHGNFIFDQMWSEETRIGVVGTYVFSGKDLVDITFDPVKIFEYGQPRLLNSPEKEKVINMLKIESQKLADTIL